jgi:hypothetical protein
VEGGGDSGGCLQWKMMPELWQLKLLASGSLGRKALRYTVWSRSSRQY